MDLGEHLHITGGALKNWIVAQAQDSVAVGLLWLRAPEGPILILHGWGAKGSLESWPPKANCRFLACYNLVSPAFVSRQSIDLLWRRILRNYSLLDTRYLHVRPFKMGHNQA